MKKLITLITVIIMVLMISVSAFSVGRLMGDVDSNGEINAADARSTLRVSAKLDTFSEEQSIIADIDRNGQITASDARSILRVAAKLDAAQELEEETTEITNDKPIEDPSITFPEEITTAIPEDQSVFIPDETTQAIPEEPAEETTEITNDEPIEDPSITFPEEITTAIPEDQSVFVPEETTQAIPEEPSEEITEDISPDDALPEPIQALYDGKYLIESVENNDFASYKTVIAMADGVGYYEWSYESEYYEPSGSGYIVNDDGSVYEFSIPEMIAGVVTEEDIELYYTGTVISSLKNIAENHIDYVLSTETFGGVQYDVYTFNDAYNIIKIFISDGEIARFVQYDATDYYSIENLPVTEFKTDFDVSEINTDRFAVYSYDEYVSILYGDDYDEDYYYMDEEYWASPIDWESVEGTLITNEEELPEEYFLIAADKYYINSFSRSIAEEEDIFAENGYLYYETSMYYNDDVIKIADGYDMGISIFYVEEEGQDEISCYLVYEDGGVYTEIDEFLASMFDTDYDELTQFELGEMKLLEDKEHTVTVKEAELDGEKYMLITCAYTDESYVTNFCFRNGELISIEDYEHDGSYLGTMIVYEYATEFDNSETSLDSYEKVDTFSFFSTIVGF